MMFKGKILILSAFLSFCLFLFLLLKPEESEYKQFLCPDCNVILIGIDALRADHLGAYGYLLPTSPVIDSMAKKSVVFKKNYSQAHNTTPSFMSMLTSLYPTDHGILSVHSSENQTLTAISEEIKTFPEIMKENGYKTRAFITALTLPPKAGFSRGFDEYSKDTITNQRTNLLSWIRKNSSSKFFAFFHDISTHAPYVSSEKNKQLLGVTEKLKESSNEKLDEIKDSKLFFSKLDPKNKGDISYAKSLYDASIRDVDDFIGDLIKTLEREKISNKTIIVFTSDHGEEFQEHGEWGHNEMYNELLHVPLIIKSPSLSHININQVTRSIDIMPTVLDMLNIDTGVLMRGISLLSLISEPDKYINSPVVAITRDNISVMDNGYKYIDHGLRIKNPDNPGNKDLYNIKLDPKEKNNLILKNRDTADDLKDLYFEIINKKEYYYKPTRITIKSQDKMLEELKTLGY